MTQHVQKRLFTIFLFAILLIGFLFRFSYLNWGYPFFFHPDENNIMNAIGQMSFHQWNPHFFAYGGLPIYTAFLISSMISFGNRDFVVIAYTLRSISAILSFLLIPSIFIIGKKLFSPTVGYIAAILSVFSVGFIQFAHFGTFEMWITFLTLWLFYGCAILYKQPTKRNSIFIGILVGALISVKVSSVLFFVIPLGILFIKRNKTTFFTTAILYIVSACCIYLFTNPYLLLDTQPFIASLAYESSVAVGSYPVFYTQSFIHTTPVLFQLVHIFPFLLNPFVLFAFFVSLIYLIIKIREWNYVYIFHMLFLIMTFFSQAFLFVKWTRYMIPTLPFIYLTIGVVIAHTKKNVLIGLFLSFVSFIYAIIFLWTVYPIDSRLAAASFAKLHLQGQNAIVEPYDLGALPFISIVKGKIVNLYDLEQDPLVQQKLHEGFLQSTVFLSLSQRLSHTRLMRPKDFPLGNSLYTHLNDGSLGFKKIYQTPCNFWCDILYSGDPAQSVEETATTFDHPFVTIFAKQ